MRLILNTGLDSEADVMLSKKMRLVMHGCTSDNGRCDSHRVGFARRIGDGIVSWILEGTANRELHHTHSKLMIAK